VLRQLWANGKGKFATKGRYASATIRGTTWLTIDRSDATVIRVTAGKVAVRDFKKKRTVVIGKGRTYTARR
jgi:ferric-dicitrate binding protein FerR (iron transport regulator)